MPLARFATVISLCAVTAFAAPPVNIDDLLKQMTLEEKVGQLAQVGGMAFIPGAPKPEEEIRKGRAGSILWSPTRSPSTSCRRLRWKRAG